MQIPQRSSYMHTYSAGVNVLKRQKDTLCSPLSISDFSEHAVCISAPRISFRLSVCWVTLVWHLSEWRLVSVQLSITQCLYHSCCSLKTRGLQQMTANAAMHENILSVWILLLWLNHYRRAPATVLSSPPLSAFFCFSLKSPHPGSLSLPRILKNWQNNPMGQNWLMTKKRKKKSRLLPPSMSFCQ